MSQALDTFNAYIATDNAAVDTYIAGRKAAIDGSTLSNGEKTQVKAMLDQIATQVHGILNDYIDKGEVYYALVAKEVARHIKKHVIALTTAENQETSTLLQSTIDSLTTEDDGAIVTFAQALVG